MRIKLHSQEKGEGGGSKGTLNVEVQGGKGGGRGVLIREQRRLTEENKGHNKNNNGSQYKANII